MPVTPNASNSALTVSTALTKPTSSNGLSADTRSLDALKSRAATDPRAATKDAARQFEALFMGELIKSMRANTQATGMLDNAGTQLGTELLDKQLSSQISGRPGGLSEAIMKQLERQMGMAPGPIPTTGSANNAAQPLQAARKQGQAAAATRIPQAGAAGFVQQHMASARAAEAGSGIPASFMVSQAALETGWGRKEIKHSDGSPSFNLFGIKAGSSWKGPVAEVATTEFVDGKATRVMAKFRAYGSYAESFSDYAKLMTNSPRYQAVLKGVQQTQTASNAKDGGAVFAQNMQRAGYATDPDYAGKLSRVINTTLRLQRTQVG